MIDKKNLDLNSVWQGFLEKVVPPNCSQIQLDETKLAFHAGFVSCFEIVNNISELSEDEACAALDKIRTESFDVMQQLIDRIEEQ